MWKDYFWGPKNGVKRARYFVSELEEKGTEILMVRVLRVVRGAQKNARFFVQKGEIAGIFGSL